MQLTESEWRMYAPVNYVNIDSDDRFSSERRQVII